MKILIFLIALLSILLLQDANAQRPVSTLSSSSYSKKTGLMTYSVLPFGSVNFPGKWRKAHYYDASRQQNFTRGDSMKTAIAITRAVAYPFFKKHYSENQMAREMYEWDSQYLVERSGGERIIVKDDTVNHFIIWKLSSSSDNAGKVPVYLFGSERGVIYNLNIVTDRWDDDQKVLFLQEMYHSRKTGNCCQ